MDVIGFVATMVPIALSPGASFTLALNNVVTQGARGVLRIIIGTALGIYTHALLASIGISALLLRYPALMRVLTLLGTGYLVYLALRLIQRGWQGSARAPASGRSLGIRAAYVANVLNIKAILLYVTVVPLFASTARDSQPLAQSVMSFMALATVHVAIMGGWLLLTTQVLLRSARAVNMQRMETTINLGGGLMLLWLTLWPYWRG
ncbi:LysE family translocator [Candidatus Symbiopectobacterium sp. NZEC135]|uniref:LysE family translocator n=1 Tax=Candidatus Symbiopectobacterium sp. NZEC135 TaxID=2820471 RepID=UPI0022264EC4|nr:LysE family translocator [Candidatus Symbiopectobacterium sp. NZEC135]MCW2478757.1 LysE family translocator [Candidatus Symbiopectobacterium sp. NZEC135]